MNDYPHIALRAAAAQRVESGHPWVYRDGLDRGLRVEAGDPVILTDAQGKALAVGLADPESALAVRVLGGPNTRVGESFFESRLANAYDNRIAWGVLEQTNGFRWLHGENDFLPGFVVDFYDGTAVVKLDGPYERWLDDLSRALLGFGDVKSVVYRGDDARVLAGEVPPKVVLREFGYRLQVDVLHGQKTGLFLDQRENRKWVGERAAGKRVLNLFSYTGGFSIAALAAGAEHVESVDIATPALAEADASVLLNGFDPSSHRSTAEDCHAFLQRAAKQGRTWDLVILDPPSLARRQADLRKATRAYESLNRAAMRVLEPEGVLATASCTARLTPAMFEDMLASAADATRRSFQIIREAGAGADHPVRVGFREGRYLKFLGLQSVNP